MKHKTRIKSRRYLSVAILLLLAVMMIALPCAIATAETVPAEVSPVVGEDLSWLNQYMHPGIIALCLVIGVLVKHCTPINNKYIPLIVALLGLIAAVITDLGQGITLATLSSGLWSGLASTGFHQLITKLFFKTE